MKKHFWLIFIIYLVSCANEKTLQLPEIEHSDITEIQDVSAAYLFYDETQKDSVLLNRKNLISTTNWLVNVDKRLTLKQAIPHIKFLQEKKKNASHKNEHAKNYFTCHDTSKNNLGFIEFTNVVYDTSNVTLISNNRNKIILHSSSENEIKITTHHQEGAVVISNIESLTNDLNELTKTKRDTLILHFNKQITFQDYISIKSALANNKLDSLPILKTEFIY